MTSPNVIPIIRDESPIAAQHEIAVVVPQLVRDDLRGVAVFQALDGERVTPIVERGSGQSQGLTDSVVDAERGGGSQVEQGRVLGEISGVSGENVPRPPLGSAYYTVTPRGLAALGVGGPRYQINVTTPEPESGLPFDSGSRHKGFQRPIGQRECSDKGLGLFALQPEHAAPVGLVASDIADGVVRDNVALNQPTGEDGQRGTVAVLGGAGNVQPPQESADRFPREMRCWEGAGDHTSDLCLVAVRPLPFRKGREKVGIVGTIKNLLKPSRFVGVEQRGQTCPLCSYEFQGGELALALQRLDELLDCPSCRRVVRPARADYGRSVRQVDAGQKDPAGSAPVGHLSSQTASRTEPPQVQRPTENGVTRYMATCSGRGSNPQALNGQRILSFSALPYEERSTIGESLPNSEQRNTAKANEASSQSSSPFALSSRPDLLAELDRWALPVRFERGLALRLERGR